MRAPLTQGSASRGPTLLTPLGLSLAVGVSNGLARFAYALVLPAMRNDLGWTYTEAGWNNTANAIGYLIGAVIAFRIARQVGPRRLFIRALWITSVAILVTGFTSNAFVLAALRLIAGTSGAIVFIAGSVLAANVFPNDLRKAAISISIYYAGGGIALLASGLVLPFLLRAAGDSAWPYAWIGMGVVSLAVTLLVIAAARNVAEPAIARDQAAWEMRPFVPLLAAYGAFGLGYIAYMTFVVARMREGGSSAFDVALFWSILGVATVVSPPLWRKPLSEWRGGHPLALVLLGLAAGSAVPVWSTSLPAMIVSGLVFGIAFFAAPAAVTAFSRKSLHHSQWGEAIAGFTIVFAVCQCLGPVLSGYVSDMAGQLSAGLGVSTLVLFAGAGIALLQRDVSGRQRRADDQQRSPV